VGLEAFPSAVSRQTEISVLQNSIFDRIPAEGTGYRRVSRLSDLSRLSSGIANDELLPQAPNAMKLLSQVDVLTARPSIISLTALAICIVLPSVADAELVENELQTVQIQSTADQSLQPARYLAPASAADTKTPLLVFLHSWGGSYKQHKPNWIREAVRRNWIFLQPDFRGPNNRPQACGSEAAQQDILDAIDWAKQEFKVDLSRIYLVGASGGGHMALLMAGRYPQRFSAVSAWVGITDLAAWHRFHSAGKVQHRYAKMIEQCCGGPPGTSTIVDHEYRQRSPLHWLGNIHSLPIDLAAGVHDGKKGPDGRVGSVPFVHTINAFNVIASRNKTPIVSDAEVENLQKHGRLDAPTAADADPNFGRTVYLRRTSANSRVTIFEGGHEGLPRPICAWLQCHRRPTSSITELAR